MDPQDVEHAHPEIRSALRRSKYCVREPERYVDDEDAYLDKLKPRE